VAYYWWSNTWLDWVSLAQNEILIKNPSRDDPEVGVAQEVKLPKNQPQFSQTTMEQVKPSLKKQQVRRTITTL